MSLALVRRILYDKINERSIEQEVIIAKYKEDIMTKGIELASSKKIELQQAKKILKVLNISEKKLNELKDLDVRAYYVSMKAHVQEDDGQTNYWSWEDIVKRYNQNYGKNYEKRKLRDAFSKTITQLNEAYENVHGKRQRTLLDNFKDDGGEYYFPKKHMSLKTEFGISVEELLDTELDELCEMFALCLQFCDGGRRTVSGIKRIGELLGKDDDRAVFNDKDGMRTLEQEIQEAVRCYIVQEMTLYEMQNRIEVVFQRVEILKKDKEETEKFLNNSLYQILEGYGNEIVSELENIKLCSRWKQIMENASIRTYTPRGTKLQNEKKNDIASISFNVEEDSTKIYDIQDVYNFVQSAYDMAVQFAPLKKEVDDSKTNSNWKKKMGEIQTALDFRKRKDRILNETELKCLNQMLIEELICWTEKAELLINYILGARFLEKIRYYRKNERDKEIKFNKKTGELYLPRLEEGFWKNKDIKSTKEVLEEQILAVKNQYHSDK